MIPGLAQRDALAAPGFFLHMGVAEAPLCNLALFKGS